MGGVRVIGRIEECIHRERRRFVHGCVVCVVVME